MGVVSIENSMNLTQAITKNNGETLQEVKVTESKSRRYIACKPMINLQALQYLKRSKHRITRNKVRRCVRLKIAEEKRMPHRSSYMVDG
jgi:hypothetical protein